MAKKKQVLCEVCGKAMKFTKNGHYVAWVGYSKAFNAPPRHYAHAKCYDAGAFPAPQCASGPFRLVGAKK